MMEDRIKKLENAKNVLLSFRFSDKKDEELLTSIIELRMTIDEFFSVFNFPRGTNKLFLNEQHNTMSKTQYYKKLKDNKK